uniref:Uncharacterized protein n=1 Tax=Taeniopygia guttata TaxID=59729 RepID=A0A674H6U4_TAEGU
LRNTPVSWMYCSSNSRLVVLIFVFPVNISSHEQTAQRHFFWKRYWIPSLHCED